MVNELWVTRDLLGTTYSAQAEGTACAIRLPTGTEDKSFRLDLPINASRGNDGDLMQAFRVRAVEVAVTLDTKADHAAVEESVRRNRPQIDCAMKTLDEGHEVATRVLDLYLAWARAKTGQHWLGVSGERISAYHGDLFDVDENRFRVGYPALTASMRAVGDLALDPLQHEHHLRAAITREGPQLDSISQADAMHLATSSTRQNLRHAVLLAAIACELAVKRTLLSEVAGPTQADLVSLVLDNPRDVSVSAVNLFHKGCQAVSGRSLRKESPGLFKRVEHLFEDRNRIADRGHSVMPEDPRLIDDVQAAGQALAWLEALRHDPASPA